MKLSNNQESTIALSIARIGIFLELAKYN